MYVRYRVKIGRDVEGGGGGGGGRFSLRCASLHEHFLFYTFSVFADILDEVVTINLNFHPGLPKASRPVRPAWPDLSGQGSSLSGRTTPTLSIMQYVRRASD